VYVGQIGQTEAQAVQRVQGAVQTEPGAVQLVSAAVAPFTSLSTAASKCLRVSVLRASFLNFFFMATPLLESIRVERTLRR
jgi:hypothetical protein